MTRHEILARLQSEVRQLRQNPRNRVHSDSTLAEMAAARMCIDPLGAVQLLRNSVKSIPVVSYQRLRRKLWQARQERKSA